LPEDWPKQSLRAGVSGHYLAKQLIVNPAFFPFRT
jgi:hypothetical protein